MTTQCGMSLHYEVTWKLWLIPTGSDSCNHMPVFDTHSWQQVMSFIHLFYKVSILST